MKIRLSILMCLLCLVVGKAGAVKIPVQLKNGDNVVKEWEVESGVASTIDFDLVKGTYTISLPGYSINGYSLSFQARSYSSDQKDRGGWYSLVGRYYYIYTWTHMTISGTQTSGGTTQSGYMTSWGDSTPSEYPSASANSNGATITVSGEGTARITSITINFTPTDYTVTFNANGGQCGTQSKTVNNYQEYGELPTPTKGNYKFSGWYTEDGNKVVASTKYISANPNDHTLYARYAPINNVYEAPTSGQYYLYNVANNKYLKATNTVADNISDATIFTISGTENCTISYDDNGTTKYVYESKGDGSWGETNNNKWTISANNGGYYISHTDPGNTSYTRYIDCYGSGIDYPHQNFNNNNRTWQFISVNNMSSAEKDTDADASGKIMNANGNYDPNYFWTITGTAYRNGDNGKDGKPGFFEVQGPWGCESFECKMEQTVTGLENGKYRLKVDCQASENATLKVYAGSNEITTTSNIGWVTYEVDADVTDGTLTIGARSSANSQYQWANVDNFKLYKLTEAKMYINKDVKYGTFVAPFDVDVPEGVTAYTISNQTDEYAHFTSVGKTITKGTPVVVYKVDGYSETPFYGISEVSGETVNGANGLVGVLSETGKDAPTGSYVINYINNKSAFYIVGSKTIHVGKNRCYLKETSASGEGPSKILGFVFDEPTETSVSSVETPVSISSVYSTSGTRLECVQKGMNIIKYSDGSVKKVFIK